MPSSSLFSTAANGDTMHSNVSGGDSMHSNVPSPQFHAFCSTSWVNHEGGSGVLVTDSTSSTWSPSSYSGYDLEAGHPLAEGAIVIRRPHPQHPTFHLAVAAAKSSVQQSMTYSCATLVLYSLYGIPRGASIVAYILGQFSFALVTSVLVKMQAAVTGKTVKEIFKSNVASVMTAAASWLPSW